MKILPFGERRKQFLLLVLILTLSSIVTDIYLPSFLEMPSKLETTMNGVQWSLSLFVLMLAFAHLIYGPLAERFGRKKVLLFGLAIAFLGSLLCVVAVTLLDLLVGRVLQGLGVGAAAVLWRDIAQEKYGKESSLKEASYLVPTSLVVIILAPFVGGLIQTYLGWRANFAYILFHVALVFVCVYFLFQEDSQKRDPQKKTFSFSFYKNLLSQKKFLAYSFCAFFSYGAFFTWTGSGPVVLMEKLHLTPYELGLAMVLTALPMGFGALLYGSFIKRFSRVLLFRLALLGMTLSTLALSVVAYFIDGSLWILLIPICFFMFFSGFFWPNLFRGLLRPFREKTSSAVAFSLYGFFQLLGAASLGVFLSIFTKESELSIGLIMFSCLFICTLIYEVLIVRKSK